MSEKPKIQTEKITAFDRDYLARITIESTAKFFQNPSVQKRFEEWKKNKNKEPIISK